MIIDILLDTLMVTGFVVIMMLLIECINLYTGGCWRDVLQQAGFRQMLMAVLLGLLPGCLGGFAVVSLFTHGMVSFGALVACMIATFGDEAFILYALAPRTAVLLTVVLFIIAMVTGWIVQAVVLQFPVPFSSSHWEIHQDDLTHDGWMGSIRQNLRHLTVQRVVLLLGILLFAVCMLSGVFEHHAPDGDTLPHTLSATRHGWLTDERGLNYFFALLCGVTFVIVLKVTDHFLKEHLWHHILESHFPRIFLWTLAIVLLIAVLDRQVGINAWVQTNPLPVLCMALLIGLIPQSGPHVVFITLFIQGTIPFSVLLANSIVQEGHAGLPLFAESKRGFLWMKAISVFVGLTVGLLGFFLEF